MTSLYLFSGLGTDHRIFQRLDFSGFAVHHIQWIPALAGERIDQYAKRLTGQIDTPRPILVGVSFGGIMAVEVAKYLNPRHVILLSSAKTSSEIPFSSSWLRTLGLHRIFPVFLLKRSWLITDWFFGIQGAADKQLLGDILRDTDPSFLRWAIDQMMRWKNTIAPEKTTHVHGTHDRILPYRFVHADIALEGGGHFMVFNRAKEISEIISGAQAV